jgi:hypothetical protein
MSWLLFDSDGLSLALRQFGVDDIKEADDDWSAITTPATLPFQEFFFWWSTDGSFNYSGNGHFLAINQAWKILSKGDPNWVTFPCFPNYQTWIIISSSVWA